MSTSNSDWVKQRLPSDASFTKNGMSYTVDTAVTAALADYTTGTDRRKRCHALADLLEWLDAEIKFNAETMGDSSYTGPRYADRIRALREEAETDESPGTFQSVPIIWQPVDVSDENSS